MDTDTRQTDKQTETENYFFRTVGVMKRRENIKVALVYAREVKNKKPHTTFERYKCEGKHFLRQANEYPCRNSAYRYYYKSLLHNFDFFFAKIWMVWGKSQGGFTSAGVIYKI